MQTITIDGFNLTAQQVVNVSRTPHLKVALAGCTTRHR